MSSPGPPTIRVRSPMEADSSSYADLLRRLDGETTYLAWEPGERHLDPKSLEKRFREMDPTREVVLVAESQDRLVGFLVAYRGAPRRNAHRASFTMGVLKECWGMRIGRELLGGLETWARKTGIWRLELAVMAHNERAIGLYEKSGYEREGVRRSAMVVNGEDVDEILMGKILSRPDLNRPARGESRE